MAWLTSFLGFLSYLSVAKLTNLVRAVAKMSAGSVSGPLVSFTASLCTKSYQLKYIQTTAVKKSCIE